MTMGEMERAKELARNNFNLQASNRPDDLWSNEMGLMVYKCLDDAVSIGSAIASGYNVELTDDGVRVIVEGGR